MTGAASPPCHRTSTDSDIRRIFPRVTSAPDPDLSEPHLLVVDDDARLRELLRRYLSDSGFRVTAAAEHSTPSDPAIAAVTEDAPASPAVLRIWRPKRRRPKMAVFNLALSSLGAINQLRGAVERATIKFSVRGKVVEVGREREGAP